MRVWFTLWLYATGVVCAGALLAYPLYLACQVLGELSWLEAFSEFTFRRIADRAFMLAALVGLYPLLRSFHLTFPDVWGYPRTLQRRHRRQIVAGVAGGLSLLLILTALEWALGIRVADRAATVIDLVEAVMGGLAAGLLISLIEETFFRGALMTVFMRRHRTSAPPVTFTALLYAGLHFVRSSPLQNEPPNWLTGFHVLGSAFHRYADSQFVGPFLALFMLGVVLAELRLRYGHILVGIGVHTGLVAGIRLTHTLTDSNARSPLFWLADGYDNVTGYLAFLLIFLAWLALRHRTSRCLHPPEHPAFPDN